MSDRDGFSPRGDRMKQSITFCMAFMLCLFVTGVSLAIPLTAPGNRHNLSKNSGGVQAVDETRICVFCHTPHGASPQSQLWNRKDPSETNFPLYVSPSNTLEIQNIPAAGYSNADQTKYPNGASRMCLSCHDGVSSIGAVISENANILMNYDTLGSYDLASGLQTTIDLSRSHPISFVYSNAVKDAINAAEITGGGAVYQLPSSASKVTLDRFERMQCTTCHDPHNDTNNGTDYTLPFWANKVADEASDYDNTCNECHVSGDWNSWDTSPSSFPNH